MFLALQEVRPYNPLLVVVVLQEDFLILRVPHPWYLNIQLQHNHLQTLLQVHMSHRCQFFHLLHYQLFYLRSQLKKNNIAELGTFPQISRLFFGMLPLPKKILLKHEFTANEHKTNCRSSITCTLTTTWDGEIRSERPLCLICVITYFIKHDLSSLLPDARSG